MPAAVYSLNAGIKLPLVCLFGVSVRVVLAPVWQVSFGTPKTVGWADLVLGAPGPPLAADDSVLVALAT